MRQYESYSKYPFTSYLRVYRGAAELPGQEITFFFDNSARVWKLDTMVYYDLTPAAAHVMTQNSTKMLIVPWTETVTYMIGYDFTKKEFTKKTLDFSGKKMTSTFLWGVTGASEAHFFFGNPGVVGYTFICVDEDYFVTKHVDRYDYHDFQPPIFSEKFGGPVYTSPVDYVISLGYTDTRGTLYFKIVIDDFVCERRRASEERQRRR